MNIIIRSQFVEFGSQNVQGQSRRPETSLECVLVCLCMLYVFLCVVWSLKSVEMTLKHLLPYLGSKPYGYNLPKGPPKGSLRRTQP